jgi:gliding motility-associated-like protein
VDADGNSSSQADCNGEPNCNKVFKVVASGQMSIEIFIYNRWGQLVYKSTDAEEGWDGKMIRTNELCPQEVYVYQVNATSFSGKKFKYSGSVTLLR